jgi:hypothetical protein
MKRVDSYDKKILGRANAGREHSFVLAKVFCLKLAGQTA